MTYTYNNNCINTVTVSTSDYWSGWTTVTSDATWGYWVCDSTTTAISGNATTYTYVANNAETFNRVWGQWAYTREQKQEARKRKIRERREQEEIAARARRLLFTLLSDEEQIDFRRYGSVRIAGKENIYEIGESSDLVTVLDSEGDPQHKLCLHPSLSYPKMDRLAATLLALRFDEAAAVRLGNKHGLGAQERARIIARRGHRAA